MHTVYFDTAYLTPATAIPQSGTGYLYPVYRVRLREACAARLVLTPPPTAMSPPTHRVAHSWSRSGDTMFPFGLHTPPRDCTPYPDGRM
jgi:hypothetical protein